MNHYLKVWFCLLFLMAACGDEDSEQGSELEKSGVLGQWELQSRSYDGINPLIIEVGQYLALLEDENQNDLIGNFLARSPGSETEGVFELDPSAGTIRFEFRDRMLIYLYDVQNDALIFDYEEDGTDISEVWIRVEADH